MLFLSTTLLDYSTDEEDHQKHLWLVLQTLRRHKLYVMFSKFEFRLDNAIVFGHVISERGVSMDFAKVEEVVAWEKSKAIADIRSFLGLAGYYQRFI